ncbi:hypothetical protein GGI25_002561 [Coemansia spiralis]|uniref:Gag1-like clamp domain-containing protein n=1 Tax=Coemansia spiralis TaxID=417178 RepID=A0A9W8KYE6_9FUNG|nr:hypothetical protein BX070DRAFT_230869 [Coemansia spiralis]KAJ2622875.1 hypothetical protein GGI26_002841 [Coemansia sp. RSA 1358]KAJ2678210.1 hypothetical protein GGI25_002561 [Coemansia spiralis]
MAFELSANTSIGLEHWLEQNRRWREAKAPSSGDQLVKNQNTAKRKRPIGTLMYNHVFRKLVMEKRPLKEPLPLAEAIPILIHGWKQAGVWPADPQPPLPAK